VPHEDADHVVAGLAQQRRRHAAIDSPDIARTIGTFGGGSGFWGQGSGSGAGLRIGNGQADEAVWYCKSKPGTAVEQRVAWVGLSFTHSVNFANLP